MDKIKVGDYVKWESQAQGCYVVKEGTVIALLAPGEGAFQHLPAGVKKTHIKFQSRSQIERALVKVMAGVKKDIAHYYAPRVSMLQKETSDGNGN